MLMMKRMIYPYEVRKCKISDEFIVYGDYYYQDDEDELIIVKATVYHEMQKKARDANFDYTMFNNAQNQVEYDRMVKQAEKDFLSANILNMAVFNQGHAKKNGLE